jgi:hypothetical protein
MPDFASNAVEVIFLHYSYGLLPGAPYLQSAPGKDDSETMFSLTA